MTREEAGALQWDPIRRPAPLFFQSFFAGGGLMAAWLLPHHSFIWICIILASLAVACLFRVMPPVRWCWGCGLFLIFYAYGCHTYHHITPNDLRNVDLALPRTVQLKLIPLEEPAWKPGVFDDQVGNAVCRVTALNPGDGWRPVKGEVWARLRGNPQGSAFYGLEAVASGYLEMPGLAAGPGQFDFGAYLKSSGIYHTFEVHLQDWELSDEFTGWHLLRWANALRRYMIDVLQWGLDDSSPWPSLMAAMLFGYRDGISAEMMNEFTVTGTLHLFAVSGQNVGMILWVFLIFLRSFGVIRWRWGWLVAPGLLMFCLSTGLESSASRALVMIVLVLAGWLAYRPITPLNLLGAAALILWTWDPWQLLDVGFQLSFLVLLVLLVATGGLARRLYLPIRPDVFIPRERLPKWRLALDQCSGSACMLLAASTVAWLASLPLIWYHFGLVSPITILSNFLVVPMAGLVVVLALFSVLSSVLLSSLAVAFNLLNAKVLMLMTWVISSLAAVPGGHYYLSRDAGMGEDHFKLTLLSGVRHAPAILETRERVVLIGVGTQREWKYQIDPARKYLGHESLDMLVALQANERSLGALPAILPVLPVDVVIVPPHPSRSPAYRKWENYRIANGGYLPAVRAVASGDLLWTDEKTAAQVIWPDSNDNRWSSQNAGLMLLLQLDGINVLMAGNPGEQVETGVTAAIAELDIPILVQGPHAQEPGLSFSWLKNLRPEVIVRPESGFYPENDMPMEKRIRLDQLAAEWLELEHAGPIQIRGGEGGYRLLNWDAGLKKFTDGKHTTPREL
ncbi:MAG: ComEC/Rec2 family competence protein [Verrucomicrobiota bacterium]